MILSGAVVFAFESCATGARRGFGSRFVRPPVTPLAIQRTVIRNIVIDDAATFTIRTIRESHRDNLSVLYANPVVLRARVPTELIDVATRDHFERPFIGSPVWI